MFIGSIFCEFVGASTRWIYLRIKDKFEGKKTVGFSQIYFGRKRIDDKERMEYAFSNIILGIIIVVLVSSGLVYFTT
jgi:hypothetical protein